MSSPYLPPITLSDDPRIALQEIKSYLATRCMDTERHVTDYNTANCDTLGYWQTENWLQGLDEINAEIDRITQLPAPPDPLLKGLIALGDREDSQGRWRVTLDWDNYQDGARVIDGDENVIAECYDIGPENDEEDPQKLVELQFVEAIRLAIKAAPWVTNTSLKSA